MNLTSLKDPENWERRIAIAKKQLIQAFKHPCESKPVFVLGKQRSGTSMLMNCFHRHPASLVFDEHRNNPAFERHRLRSADTIRGLLEQSRLPVVCFKPICDSHRIGELYDEFPAAHFIWLYRSFEDVSNSTLRKFDAPTHAIRLICANQPGGGWLQEGVSPRMADVLKDIYRPDLSDFDFACLSWWLRNQIIVESGLIGAPNLTFVKYEALVLQPTQMLEWLFDRIEIGYRKGIERKITARFIGRNVIPEMDERIQHLCVATLDSLDRAFLAGRPPD